MSQYVMAWPKNERFRKIASKIADKTTLGLFKGVQVSAKDSGCHCPLGCAVASFRPTPLAVEVRGLMSWHEADAFILGFDGKPVTFNIRGLSAYYRLGLAYRKRFP